MSSHDAGCKWCHNTQEGWYIQWCCIHTYIMPCVTARSGLFTLFFPWLGLACFIIELTSFIREKLKAYLWTANITREALSLSFSLDCHRDGECFPVSQLQYWQSVWASSKTNHLFSSALHVIYNNVPLHRIIGFGKTSSSKLTIVQNFQGKGNKSFVPPWAHFITQELPWHVLSFYLLQSLNHFH